MANEEEQVFDCKEPCDPPCEGKVYYRRRPDDTIPALSKMETATGPKIVYLECDNPKGEHHINPYEV